MGVQQAADALGLLEGPIHAELLINEQGIWFLEVAARSIGGYCSRSLRFTNGKEQISLEEIILRRALEMETNSFQRESKASGVMMIPIPRAGVFTDVRGLDQARSVGGIEQLTISAHLAQELVPLPEGALYLGFIFARAATPKGVELALRASHACLEFVIRPQERKAVDQSDEIESARMEARE